MSTEESVQPGVHLATPVDQVKSPSYQCMTNVCVCANMPNTISHTLWVKCLSNVSNKHQNTIVSVWADT